MKKCDDCKWYEPFCGVCCNPDSENCADMPWQFGVNGCEAWEGVKNDIEGGPTL